MPRGKRSYGGHKNNGAMRTKTGRFDPKKIDDGFKTPDQAVRTIGMMWSEGRSRMYPLLEQWTAQLLMFRGRQWARFHSSDTQYLWWDDPEAYVRDRIRITANLVKKFVMGWVARMTANDPSATVNPTTDDSDDRARAELQRDLIRWKHRLLNMSGKIQDLTTLLGITGLGYLMNEYDPGAGPIFDPMSRLGPGELDIYRDEAAVKDLKRFGANRMKRFLDGELPSEEFAMGEVTASVIPPFEITIPDMYPRCQDEPKYLLHSRIITMQELREKYYNHPQINEIRPGMDAWGHQVYFMRRVADGLFSGLGSHDRGGGSGGNDEEGEEYECDARDTTIIHTLWAEPNRTHPRGMRISVCDKVCLEPYPDKYDEDLHNPYLHGQIPFTKFTHTNDGVNYYPTCDLEDAMELQHQVNHVCSKIAEAIVKTANPQVMARSDCGINFDLVLNVPNEVLLYSPGSEPPAYLQMARLPEYVDSFIDRCIQLLEYIFSDQKPSRGISRSGDSGVKTRLLQGADDMRFGPYAIRFGQSLKKFWLQHLMMMAQYTSAQRVAHVVGESGELNVFTFDQESLLGTATDAGASGFDRADTLRSRILAMKDQVDLEIDVVPGKSPQQIREDLTTLTATGFLNPQNAEHVYQAWKMLGYSQELGQVVQNLHKQRALAARENDAFHKGEEVEPPHIWQDHEQHKRVHVDFLDTSRFDSMDETAKNAFVRHIEAHEKLAIFVTTARPNYLLQEALAESGDQLGPLASAADGTGAQPPQPAQPEQKQEADRDIALQVQR